MVGSRLDDAINRIPAIDPMWTARAVSHLDRLTKPPGSLGRLEALATQVCGIRRTLRPDLSRRRIVICAGDHGVTAEGVSAFPSEVTAQMVVNFLRGGAAINALAGAADTEIRVLDVGVAGVIASPADGRSLVSRRVRDGTRNMVDTAAMTEPEMRRALDAGIEQADAAAADGVTLLGLGDMGIGNTTAASAMTAAVTGAAPASVTGRGTGVDDEALAAKVQVIERALARHNLRADAPLRVLQTVGGLEIAALCGICVGAARHRLVIVVDGLISTAAAMVAVAVAPRVGEYIVAGHLSPEPGHAIQLEWLEQRPLVALEMRLGEGTGAAIAMHILGAATAAFTQMATFESAGVSER